jgi:hypothetical protein
MSTEARDLTETVNRFTVSGENISGKNIKRGLPQKPHKRQIAPAHVGTRVKPGFSTDDGDFEEF